MIELPLRIRCSPSSRREPAAWFVPGDDVRAWLDEIASWSVKHTALRLLVVPRSRRDLGPCGILVLGATRERPSPRCLPYGCAGGRLFLPVEAVLDPDVTDEDLSSLLRPDTQYVFHPSAGLCGFGAGEVLQLADLLQMPPPRSSAWDRARPGVAFAQRLTSLTPETTPTIEQVLEQGRDDIGTQSKQMRELPRSPDEPNTDLLSRAGRRGRQMLAGIVDWLARHAPGSAGGPTWINNLQDWARRQLGQVHEAWNRQRMSEIHRLMDMLQRDPDRGLKYALPIGGEAAHRGLAPPGNRLGERDVNFRLSGGGGPADFWALPDDYRQQLVARYRELANRELQLGRHRRAAYIFATLLGDLEAAATALTAGRHWREAAIIYREKLKRPLEAANCLERGGLWAEAIALFEELNEFEKAGDLHRQLDQEDEARAMYVRAVAHLSRAGALLGAARVLFEKMAEPDEALAVLELGWPSSNQAQACLRESFRLRGVLGRHAETRDRIERFQRERLPANAVATVVDVLAGAARDYPDRDVRELAADRARVHAAGRLIEAGQDERRRLLGAVERLAPEDRLLPRDCLRFLEQQKPPPMPRPRPGSKQLRRVGRLEVSPEQMTIAAATRCGDVVYLAGFRGVYLALARCNAEGKFQCTLVRLVENLAGLPVILSGALGEDDLLTLHVLGTPVIELRQVFGPTTDFPGRVRAGVQAGMSHGLIGVAVSAYSFTWTASASGSGWTLAMIGPEGQTGFTRAILDADLGRDLEDYPLPMHCWKDTVALALAEGLLFLLPGNRSKKVPLDDIILGMSGTLIGRHSLVLTLPVGACLYHDDKESLHDFTSLERPVACFLHDGSIAIGGETGLEMYGIEEDCPVKIATFPGRRARPIALMPMPQAGRFVVVSANGLVEWFEV